MTISKKNVRRSVQLEFLQAILALERVPPVKTWTLVSFFTTALVIAGMMHVDCSVD